MMTQLKVESQKKYKKKNLPQKTAEPNNTSNSLYLTIDDIQRDYLPISKKIIRRIVNEHIHTIRVGNKILVERNNLENFLENPPMLHI